MEAPPWIGEPYPQQVSASLPSNFKWPSPLANAALVPTDPTVADLARAQSDLSSVLPQITSQYPRLADVLKGASVQYGPPEARGGFLETYPPWEGHNPTPGRPNITVFDRSLNPVSDYIAADALHFLGGVDPRTGQQIDPRWAALKQQFAGSMTPAQQEMNQRAFQMDKARDPTEARSFDDWMQQSRIDAYLRGGLFPQINPEWQRPDIFSPNQQMLLQQMRQLLQTQPGGDPMMQFIMQQRGIDPVIQALMRGQGDAQPR